MKAAERLTEHTKRLPPLVVGDHVRIQNQTDPHPTKWDKTGLIIEIHQFDQYVVRVDGSGRLSIRNRKFLRKYIPVQERLPRRTIDDDLRYIPRLPSPCNPVTPLLPASTGGPPAKPSPGPIAPEPPTPGATHFHPTQDSTQLPPTLTIQPSADLPPESPAAPPISPAAPPTTPPATEPQTKKLPLALRRLMDHNKKGLLEL